MDLGPSSGGRPLAAPRPLAASSKTHLKILELFSGIGGMHCGVVHAQRLRAFRRQRRLSLHLCCCGQESEVHAPGGLCACSFAGSSACSLTGPCDVRFPEERPTPEERLPLPADGQSGLDFFSSFKADSQALRHLLEAPLDGSHPCIHPQLAAFSVEALEKADASDDAPAKSGRPGKSFSFEIQAAVDVNEAAMAVYRHNFCASERAVAAAESADSSLCFSGKKPSPPSAALDQQQPCRRPRVKACLTRGIEFLPLSFFAESGADVWLLAPPCQPFARRGKQRDKLDARCCALLRLTKVLRQLKELESTEGRRVLPAFVLVENVVGFDGSAAYEELMQALIDCCGYTVYVMRLNPLHFGIPNCRSRCFIAARLRSLDGDGPYARWFHASAPCAEVASASSSSESATERRRRPKVLSHIPGLYSAPAFFCCPLWRVESFLHPQIPPRAVATEECASLLSALELSASQKARQWHMVDLVGKQDARSSCFTKSYGKSAFAQYGSVLLLSPVSEVLAQIRSRQASRESAPLQKNGDGSKNTELHDILPPSTRCRFFSVREQLYLHGFPPDFAFCELAANAQDAADKGKASEAKSGGPTSQQQQQRYRVMIGNSLNVYLVGMLLDFLIGDDAVAPS